MDDEPYQKIYFIGIALPPGLDKQIADLKWQLHGTHEAALKPLLPHVTLLHPPSLRGIMPSELIPRVREIAERYLPLTIALTDIEFFDGTVCYIRAQSHGLDSLQAQLVRLLPPEAQALHYKRRYIPHVTLMQVYEPATLDRLHMQDVIKNQIKLPQQFEVTSVVHFTRILPREYRPEVI